MININCLKGGGGILRAALPLSLFFEMPIRLYNFRKNRNDVGIGWPHLIVLNEICQSTNSKAIGVGLGSTEFTFIPGKLYRDIIINMDDKNIAKKNFIVLVYDVSTLGDGCIFRLWKLKK